MLNKIAFPGLVLAAVFLLTPASYGQQYTISGKVTDGVSREPIPFVNVYLKGSSVGTTSDIDGNYRLKTAAAADSIVASSLGYSKSIMPLKSKVDQTVNFILERSSINLSEIVVKPKRDPAIVLFEKIIKNKERNSNKKLDNYSFEAYNKVEIDLYDWSPKFQDRRVMRPFQFVFDGIDSVSEDKPFLPIFLSESLSDYYYRSDPKDEREIIKASKQSGVENESLSQFLGSMYQEVSIYDNWPTIFSKNFVSPIADNGLNYYRYLLVDSAYVDGQYCYKMSFIPKNKGSFTFIGDMWVADSSFAVKRVSMEAADHVNLNFVDKLSLHQEFTQLKDSLWMISKDKIVVRFKVTDKALGFIGRKTTTYRDFDIDDPEINKYFATREDIVVDEKAFKKDEEFWKENRHESLTENEEGVYTMVDSIKNTKAFNTWIDIFDMVLTGYYEVGKFEFGPYSSLYSVNDVESHRFRLGIRTTEDLSDRVRLGIYGAYGLGDERFKYGGDILVLIAKDPRQSIGAEYMYDLDLKANTPADFGQENLLTGLVRRKVPQKLNLIRQASVFYEKEWKVGYSNRITLRHKSITPQFDFNYLKPTDNSHSDTVTSMTTSEATFRARFAYREKFLSGDFSRVSLGTKYPVLILQYTLGVKNVIGSGYNYHRLDFIFNDNVPINPIGTFYYTLTAGKVFGNLPYLLLNVHQGNETFFYNRYAFNMMNEYEFVSDAYISLRIRHHFEGFFLNKIPGIRKLKWRTLISAKAVLGHMTKANKEANRLNNFTVPFPKPYVEAGFGIENIFKLFEVDFLWRLTYRNAPMAPNFGVRAGIKIDF